MDKLITALKENNEFLASLLLSSDIPEYDKEAIKIQIVLNEMELCGMEVSHVD